MTVDLLNVLYSLLYETKYMPQTLLYVDKQLINKLSSVWFIKVVIYLKKETLSIE